MKMVHDLVLDLIFFYFAWLLIGCWFVQVTQLGTAAQKYQAATQNSSSNMSVSDLQSNCNM